MTEFINNTEEQIILEGKLNSENVSEIQEDLEWALNHNFKLTIDLTYLDMLDVVGVFMLLIIKKKAKSKGKIIEILNYGNEHVTQSIQLSGLQNIIDVV